MLGLHSKIEDYFAAKVVNAHSVGGGCTANAQFVSFENGKKVFVKSGFSGDMFLKEAHGLKELAKPNVVRTPKVLWVEQDVLVLELIESGVKKPSFFTDFGRQLAELHKYSHVNFGFFEDNYIGCTPQINVSQGVGVKSWCDFFLNNRLRFQVRLAKENNYADASFMRIFDRFIERVPELITGSEEKPSLLHGDLWAGNYMHDESGNAVLIDPAVYYGHREMDLAMTQLFGGFPFEFYESYRNTFPLQLGYQERIKMYTIYHLLNHLNLFGSGYYLQCIQLMKEFH